MLVRIGEARIVVPEAVALEIDRLRQALETAEFRLKLREMKPEDPVLFHAQRNYAKGEIMTLAIVDGKITEVLERAEDLGDHFDPYGREVGLGLPPKDGSER